MEEGAYKEFADKAGPFVERIGARLYGVDFVVKKGVETAETIRGGGACIARGVPIIYSLEIRDKNSESSLKITVSDEETGYVLLGSRGAMGPAVLEDLERVMAMGKELLADV